MRASVAIAGENIEVDFDQPLDISIPLRASEENVRAWYVDPPEIEPVMNEFFTGSVKKGGPVNFNNIFFNPHGHGTHTECVGHIAEEVYSVNRQLNRFFFLAELISLGPEEQDNGDLMITEAQVRAALQTANSKAVVLRTLPNSTGKLSRNYSSTNPPYMEPSAMQFLIDRGVEHLLIDLPSVDPEEDGGALKAHHVFWEHPDNTNFRRTITEMIYVPDEIEDGQYLLNLQIASFENDASPSKPVLYEVMR